MRQSEVVALWRERFESALADAEVPSEDQLDGRPVNSDVRIQHTVEPCAVAAFSSPGDRFDENGDFIESPVLGAREVALLALCRLPAGGDRRYRAPDAAELVDEVLSEPSQLRPSLSRWVREADRAALTCMTARARGWFVDARAIASRHGDPDWQPPVPLRHLAPGTGVSLKAPVDAIRSDGRSKHLLVVLPSPRDRDDRVARRIALLWVLQRGEVVSSVVCGHRSALTRRGFAVDDDFLALACQEAAAEVAMAQRPSLAAVSPGVHCRYCDLRPECPEGSARVESVVRLPFPSRSPRCR